MWVGLVLGFAQVGVVEASESGCDVCEHGQVNFAAFVVLVYIESKITFAVPEVGDFMVLLENSHEVASMLFADVLNNGVVNAEREADMAPFMHPKTRCDFTLVVALLVESFFEQLLGN